VASADAPDAPPVVVLTEKIWSERFGADHGVLGKTVNLDQRPFTIVGVMPAIFKTPPNVPFLRPSSGLRSRRIPSSRTCGSVGAVTTSRSWDD